MVMWRLIEGDCRSVDLLGPHDMAIIDPPYADTSLSWDRIVHGWLPVISTALRPVASIWYFASMRHLMAQRTEAQMRRHGFRYSQDLVWEKQNGTGFHNDRFRRVHEHAVLFYRGRWSDVYHETQHTMDAVAKTVRRKTRPTHTGHIDSGHYVSHDGGPRLERSVLQVRNEHGRAIHPTQKPVELLRKLIRYSCPPSGSVLDPFAGSGSAGIASILEARRFVGVELDADMHSKATERLTQTYAEVLW